MAFYKQCIQRRVIAFLLGVVSVVVVMCSIGMALPVASAAPAPNVTDVPPTSVSSVISRYPDLITALQKGNIETAIGIIQKIEQPHADEVKMLSMGVRIMLDHLYVIDATDFQMPSVKAKMDAALRVAERAIQADPEAADGWAAKALALNWAYRSDEAMATINHARDLDPFHPASMVVEAEIDAELHHYDEAQGLLDEVFDMVPSAHPPNRSVLARAYYIRGNVEQILGHTEPAIAAYESAWGISASPYDVDDPWMVVPPGYILYQLGPIYLFAGKSDIALKRYTAALLVDHQDAFLYYLRGRVYRYAGDTKSAITEFTTCQMMDALQWRCWRNLGQIAYEQGQWSATKDFFQPIVDDNSQISDDYYYLGTAIIQMHSCKQALPYLRRGLILVQAATGNPRWTEGEFKAALVQCDG
jgi:tetratricopeptide (TPR) repeat protein